MFRYRKPAQRSQARAMRRAGRSLAFTASALGVAKSTVSLWVRDLPLDEAQQASINCHLGNGLTLEEIERWWLERLDLPRACLRTAAVNRPSSASRRARRPLLYGTARVVVHSTEILQSIYGAIQEYAGWSRPGWIELGLEGTDAGA